MGLFHPGGVPNTGMRSYAIAYGYALDPARVAYSESRTNSKGLRVISGWPPDESFPATLSPLLDTGTNAPAAAPRGLSETREAAEPRVPETSQDDQTGL